jgi:hypothetical protein
MRVPELELDLGTVTMRCTTDEVARTLAALLREMRLVIPLLRPDEREVLRQIMAHDNGRLIVRDVFPFFARESEAHKTLRRFRAAQFVRPANTGRWDSDEPIEVKPFARLMWDRVGEAELFPEASKKPAAAPADETPAAAEEPVATAKPVAEEVIADEQLLAVEKAADEQPLVAEEPAASAEPAADEDAVTIGRHEDWEKDDVLDLLDYANEEVHGRR